MDDIIFGGSSHSLLSSFQEMMEKEFQMSMMEELTFFLGIQVKQTKQDIFVHQAKYMKDLMKKFNMTCRFIKQQNKFCSLGSKRNQNT
jgi:hypothetical protein